MAARRDPATTPSPGGAAGHGGPAETSPGEPGTSGTDVPETKRGRGAVKPGKPAIGRRRTNPWKATFAVVLVVGLLGAALWVVLGSRLLVVRHVQITGMKRLDRAEVLDAASVRLGTPLARLDTGAVGERVATVAQVRSVAVSRSWPSTLRIAITERTPRVAVAHDGRFDLVDGAGVTVVTKKKPNGLPRLEVGGTLPGNPAVRAAVSAAAALPPSLRPHLRRITAPDAAHVTLHLRLWRRVPGPHVAGRPHGHAVPITVGWGDGSRAREKADVLMSLLPHRARRYDVSDPDVATTG